MFPKSLIESAANTLDATDVSMLVTLIRGSQKYATNVAFYSDIEQKISQASGSVKAKQLNVVLDALEELGTGEFGIVGGDEGIRYSHTMEREALVDYALNVVYNVPYGTTTGTGDDNTKMYGIYGVGRIDPKYEGNL